MERQDVNDASLAVDRERHLWRAQPLWQLLEEARHVLVHQGVPGIQKSVEVTRTHAGIQVEPDVQFARKAAQGAQR